MIGQQIKSKMSFSGLTEEEFRKFKLKRELLRRQSKSDLLSFIKYTMTEYKASWHHRHIATEIMNFWNDPEAKRLMLFVPPQHGKSQIASRHFPAYVLGLNPDVKIAAASYSIDLARSFNRDIQRIIESKSYKQIFPKTSLNSKNVAADSKGSYLRNTEEFEVVGKKGSYKAVGVMGGLSGRAVDLAIIDDPVKDAVEANSTVYRKRVWEWYVNVLQTRLHNKSKVILIMTRWHEDDLAGRLLEKESKKWKVVKLAAIKEDSTVNKYDSRSIGQALWPERHSLQKLNDLRSLSETTFQSLYQQNPTVPEGNKVKKEWFQYCEAKEVPGVVFDMWIDGAYTNSTANDPSGIMVAGYHQPTKTMYVKFAIDAYLELPGLLKLIPEVADGSDMTGAGRIYIEPKASGKSLRQMINDDKESNLFAVEIKSFLVREGKEARIQFAAPKIHSGKVVIVKGSWNEKFVHQICSFPNAVHDEYVDLIGYACEHYFKTKKSGVRRRN